MRVSPSWFLTVAILVSDCRHLGFGPSAISEIAGFGAVVCGPLG